MNTLQFKDIVRQDTALAQIGTLLLFNNHQDPAHLQRRKQQRAISDDMLQLAVAYGTQRNFNQGAIAFTLTDRSLHKTAYRKFVDRLRGLTVICHRTLQGYEVHTAYWDYKIKSKSVKTSESAPNYVFM